MNKCIFIHFQLRHSYKSQILQSHRFMRVTLIILENLLINYLTLKIISVDVTQNILMFVICEPLKQILNQSKTY